MNNMVIHLFLWGLWQFYQASGECFGYNKHYSLLKKQVKR